jgi:hypothetical protein
MNINKLVEDFYLLEDCVLDLIELESSITNDDLEEIEAALENVAEYIEFVKYREPFPVWPKPERIDIIGSNGNTGEHYGIED